MDEKNATISGASNMDDDQRNRTGNVAENPVKQSGSCWFYMSHNYCRYGSNCKYSHENPKFSDKRNSELRGKIPNSRNSYPARNINPGMHPKSSFHSRAEGDAEEQSLTEQDGKTKFRDRNSDSIASETTAHVRHKYPDSSNVQISRERPQQSRAPFRQRNLYFYRSRPLNSPKTDSPPVNVCRYFSKGFCRQGDSCRFLHQSNGRDDTLRKNDVKLVKEDITLENEKLAAETCIKPQLQNFHIQPVRRQHVKHQDGDQNDIERLRDTEIQQLKKRFPGHKLIKSSPEEIFHITFSPSDPDWSFAVSSVSLEVVFSKEYPREACVIEVLEAGNLPPILIRHLNKCISEWIKEKHQSCKTSGRIELIFRPFLRWFDRNLEELFIVGLRKVKQDVLAKEAGIEFVPYEELPGSSKVPSETPNLYDLPSQESGDVDGLHENVDESTESNNMKQKQHEDEKRNKSYVTVQESDTCIISEVNSNCSSASAEKENFSPDLLGVKLSSSKEREYIIPANTGLENFSIPKLGTEVKLLGLELRESAAAMVCTKIDVTLQCSRCKTRHEINTPPRRNNSLNCIKCHNSMQIVFQPAMLHQFSAVMGYLHLVDSQAVDIPLMECIFTVDCLNCSKQISLDGIHYGQQRVTWCIFCNKKLSIYAQSVKFHQLQPAPLVSAGHKLTTATKKEKKVIKDPAIQEGKALPDCGTCKHYKKSYRWLRFPCCGKAYPCDLCHDEKETDHEMKYASRMICGFCAKEQPYAGDKPCISCSSNMTKKAGAHWEGGKGCRDKIAMSREDRQKYAGMSKTTSRKAQSLKPNKK